jgi:hypothetical protein
MQDYNGANNPNHLASGFSTDCALCHTTIVDWMQNISRFILEIIRVNGFLVWIAIQIPLTTPNLHA